MPSTSVSSSTIPTRRPETSVMSPSARGSRTDRRAVHRVVTPDRFEQQRGVVHRRRERTDLVEARRERDQPVAGDESVGGLDPDHAAERRGLADRAAGVRAEPERGEAGRDRRRRTTTRTAGNPRGVVRVAGRAERRVLGGRTHRELVEVRLADRDATRGHAPAPPRSRCTAAPSRRGSWTSRWSRPPGCRGCPSTRPAARRVDPGPHRERPARRPRPRPRARSRASPG